MSKESSKEKEESRPDRHSATGFGQKDTQKRDGGRQGDWGSKADAIKDGIKENDTDAAAGGDKYIKRGVKDPETLGDVDDPEMKAKDQIRYDDYMKAEKKKDQRLYDNRTVKSDFKKKYKPSKHEKETDALFGGVQKKGKKRNRKSRSKKNKLVPQVYYERPKPGTDTEGRGRGRGRGGGRGGGRGRGRGRGGGGRGGGGRDYQSQRSGGRGGGGNSWRGGGRGGDRGGRGGGYNRRGGGGGFFSRGRGTVNTEVNNNPTFHNTNEYSGPPQPQTAAPTNNAPTNAPAANTNNVNIPVNVTN